MALCFALCLAAGVAGAQWEFEHTIETTLGDTTETFWLQIPADYDPGVPCPLLVGWHQWGANHLELKYSTDFDEIANQRGWIVTAHLGVSTTHWNNQATQSHVVDVIDWIAERYAVDPCRIYMVGSSMGGAAAMIFADNHLDPHGPMVAAAASVSGIQDCERRFHEQGINHSMIEAFGGTPEEVPFEYHRNSAIYFADSTGSMHRNARHLPLWLTFGQGSSDQIWREHAEDLYAEMVTFADTVVLRESEFSGHGWSCAEEDLIADFLAGCTLATFPERISISADQEGSWYWAEVAMREPAESFARFEGRVDPEHGWIFFTMVRNVARAALDLPAVGFDYDRGAFGCLWAIEDARPATLVFRGVSQEPASVLRDGQPHLDWDYDPQAAELWIEGHDAAHYLIVFDPAGLPGDDGGEAVWGPVAAPREVHFDLRTTGEGRVFYRLPAAGRVTLQLFDVGGRLYRSRDCGWQPSGAGMLDVRCSVASGVYCVRMQLRAERSWERSARWVAIW